MTRRAYLVVGCHRSGTSAMARVLSLCGAALPAHVMAGSDSNPLGHWEPQDVADLNDHLLRLQGSRWDELFGHRALNEGRLGAQPVERAMEVLQRNYAADEIVLKDPRVSLLLDVWLPALEALDYQVLPIVMVRDPREVAASLFRRNDIPALHGIILWATYAIAVQAGLARRAAHYVSYEALAADPEAELDRLEAFHGFGLPARSWESYLEMERFIHAQRRAADWVDLPASLEPLRQLYDSLTERAASRSGSLSDEAAALAWWTEQRRVYGPITSRLQRWAMADEARADGLARAAAAASAQAQAQMEAG